MDVKLPEVGSVWVWEPNKPWAREELVVTGVVWNGEEYWVETSGKSGISKNDLSRFYEAARISFDEKGVDSTELEKRIMKQFERMTGHVPVGSLDLLRILAHPDMIQLTQAYMKEKASQDLQGA